MEFMDFVASRKSVGSYADCEAEEEKVSKILEAARLAPSWANKQCAPVWANAPGFQVLLRFLSR
jgi:nitroreductase